MATNHITFLTQEYARLQAEFVALSRKPDVSGDGGGVQWMAYRRVLMEAMSSIVKELEGYGVSPDGTTQTTEMVTEYFT
jgi:hypothetical protein